ncbi:hypothetical protein [Microcoleus sp. B3-D7]|uniref:hypothetical protein n=1 Tax=Microcoleus sp. B3-D7 TaxID=2818659 RepID=UPI002FD519F9
MQFGKEYVRRQWDNQIIVRVPAGTEISESENFFGNVIVQVNTPVTKNLGSEICLSQEEFEEYVE